MFANPFWSVLLIITPVLVWYFIIAPRLKTNFLNYRSDLDSLWARIKARLWAFRTFWIAAFGAVITALPDILVQVAPLDFSPWLPQPWAAYTGPACTMTIALMKAFETKPGQDN